MMQTAVKTKKPRKQAVSGCFCAMHTFRGRIKDDHKIDPTVGSGGMLIHSKQFVEEQGGDGSKLALFGQDDYFNVTLPKDLITSSTSSPAWLGYIAAINVLGTPMLFSTTILSKYLVPGSSGTKNAIDRHHIFPKHYLQENGYSDDRDRNQVANYTYIDYATNIDISDRPPAEYVSEYRAKLGEDGYNRTCQENALPQDFEKMDYPQFLATRRKLMATIIRQGYERLCL